MGAVRAHRGTVRELTASSTLRLSGRSNCMSDRSADIGLPRLQRRYHPLQSSLVAPGPSAWQATPPTLPCRIRCGVSNKRRRPTVQLSCVVKMSAPKVLVAEDDRAVSMLVSRSLEASGVRVTAVYDGIDAYEMGKTGEFDIALLDQVMPGLLGSEVLQRWLEDGVSLPVIMISGLTDEENIVSCLDLGAVDFIRKPFSVREVLARVRVQLRIAGLGIDG